MSESSEKLLQRGRGGSLYTCDFSEWEEHALKHSFAEGSGLSQRVGITMKGFSAFLDLRKYKNWVHKITS